MLLEAGANPALTTDDKTTPLMAAAGLGHGGDRYERFWSADRALEAFSRLGVRLVLSGHFHLSYVRIHERPGTVKEGAPDGLRRATAAPILVAQTSSTTSTRLRGHPNAYNLISIEGEEIDIAVREWRDGRWITKERAHEVAPVA